MDKLQCNICGNKFDIWDAQQHLCLDIDFCYGSKYDGERLRCYFCCDCLDKMVDDYILPLSAINPIINDI